MLSFQFSECEMTLEEGLCEYYGCRDDLAVGRGMSDSAREFFRCHDAAHVVFGCSTTLSNEAMVKIWSFLGTTAGFSLLRDYRSPESKEIYAEIQWREIPGTVLRSLVNGPLVASRSLRMNKRWPWSDFAACQGAPLSEIRREYGIQVVTAP